MSENIVVIRRVQHERWHKIPWEDMPPKALVISPFIDHNSMKYVVGLSAAEIKKYSKLLGKDLTPNYDPEVPHPFWDDPMVYLKIEGDKLVLNLDEPLGYIKYRIALHHPAVANSLETYEKGLFPEAECYIDDRRRKIEQRSKDAKTKAKAFKLFAEMPLDRKLAVLSILTGASYRGAPEDEIDAALYDEIENSATRFIDVASMNPREMMLRALIVEAQYNRIVSRQHDGYYFFDEKLGDSLEDAARYIARSDKKMLLEKLREKVMG